MMFYDYITITHGKWILTGEHTVIRGGGALVFPIKEKELHLNYKYDNTDLQISYAGTSGKDFALLFKTLLQHALQKLNRTIESIQGHFHWEANLPLGQGLGASAAFCVAITRWLIKQQWLKCEENFQFAKQLEHFFHGKSSGLDIVGVSADSGMYFEQGTTSPLVLAWQPKWYLSSSNQTGLTLESVNKVQELQKNAPALARELDECMKASVINARLALELPETQGKKKLISAMNLAKNCFEAWDLIDFQLNNHMQELLNQGALAVKPTGSGGGGYIISLWENEPPNNLALIKV